MPGPRRAAASGGAHPLPERGQALVALHDVQVLGVLILDERALPRRRHTSLAQHDARQPLARQPA
jgi:hypothetical protein